MIEILVVLLILIAVRVPIAYALGLSALLYFVLDDPQLIVVLPQRLLSGMDSYALITLPLFILMGLVMNASRITAQLLNFSSLFVGALRGGLGLVNVLASMLFGGISGSSASDTASIGSVLIPEMERRGYPREFASGITVASSTMGMIIPPSIPMVLYAVVAQQSVGRLFLGGVVPGILIGVLQLAITLTLAHRRNYPRETVAGGWRHAVGETARSSPVLFMPVFVVGSVVLGIATATESAALGVLYALLIGFLVTRALAWAEFSECLRAASLTTAKIMAIIAFSQVYIWVIALERIPEALAAYVVGVGLGPTATLLVVGVIILAAGTVIDVSPAILLLTPVFLPALTEAGVSPIHFGVILVSGLAVGACTPPVGNCLNVCAAISKLGIGQIFRGAAPFLAANVATMLLITLFPSLVLWLPSVLME
ncbi:MAG: TRAP transporter large permease [bacterium]|nr:TRAP transporter large permease [bacterium]